MCLPLQQVTTITFSIIVTECICTLCLCCCMYCVCVALLVVFRVCSSFDLLRMRYVLWFRRHYETSLYVRAREGEREEQWPLICTIQKKRRNKIRKPLAVARLLFLTSNLRLPPPTIYIMNHVHHQFINCWVLDVYGLCWGTFCLHTYTSGIDHCTK